MKDPGFYIGYVPRAPRDLSVFVTRVVLGGMFGALIIAIVLVFAQAPFAEARFEYGHARTVEGTVALIPYPALLTPAGRYLLVAPGKHGIADQMSRFRDGPVRFQASLIERGGDRMLEVMPDGIGVSVTTHGTHDDISLGPVVLTGEIVDTKCYLGVMNPGEGKVHRDCAARCISGGIPPGLLVQDRDGKLRTVLLAGADGHQLSKEILEFVGEPVQVRGPLHRTAGFLVVYAAPTSISRVVGRE